MKSLLYESYVARLQFAKDMQHPRTFAISVKSWLLFAWFCCLCTGCVSWIPSCCLGSRAERGLRSKVQYNMLSISREESDALFSELDLNKDGELNPKELKSGLMTIELESGVAPKSALHCPLPPAHARH